MFFNTSNSTIVYKNCAGSKQRKHQGTESIVNNTDMMVLRIYITWQWRNVRDMASQITGNLTVVFRLNKDDIKARYYWPFLMGIHR